MVVKYTPEEIEFHYESLLELSYQGIQLTKAIKQLGLPFTILFSLSSQQQSELKEARVAAKKGYSNKDYLDGFNYINGNY